MTPSLKPDRTFFLILGAVVLTAATTYGYFAYRQQYLTQRNQFLERRYRENLDKLNRFSTEQSQTSTQNQKPQNKTFTQRDNGVLHKITVKRESNAIEITSIDLETREEILTDKDINPYTPLFTRNDLFRGVELNDIVIARDQDRLYALAEVRLGFMGSTLFEISSNQYGSDLQIQPLHFETRDRHGLCGQDLVDYFPNREQILIDAGCGDGCGAGGELRLVSTTGQEIDIHGYGAGCALRGTTPSSDSSEILPRYLGYVGGDLYFGEIEVDDEENWRSARITSIYSINPLTRVKRYVDINLEGYNFDSYQRRSLQNQLGPHELLLSANNTDMEPSEETLRYYSLNVETGEIKELQTSQL